MAPLPAESATGIREGGRTGIVALTVAFWMFIALWFTPIIASIPVYCTGPALILTGSLMMINAAHIDWNDINKAVPAFLTISIMPLTYSISYGVIGGIVSFTLLHAFQWVLDYLSSKTNGAFGRTAPAIQAPGHGAANPKDSAHNPQGNGKAAALDEEAGKPDFASDHDTNIVRPLQAGKGPEFEGDHDTNPVRAMEPPATGPK